MRTEAGLRAGRLTGLRSRSGRRGRHEPVEHGERVERPGRALRVVLDGLDRQLAVAQALDRAVVEVDLADPEPGRGRQRVADDLDLVVLGGDLDEPELEVLDRVVGAVVAEPEAARVGAGGPPDDLVAEADPEQRPAVVDDRAGQRDLRLEAGRVAGTGREDHAVDVGRRARPTRTTVCGKTRTRAPRWRIARTMFVLRPEVHDPDPRAGVAGPPRSR